MEALEGAMVGRGVASSVLLGWALLGAGPDLPDAFWRLPADVRSRATVVMSGTYTIGRGPCEVLPDGSRRWRLLHGFKTGIAYRGDVRSDYIGVKDPQLVGSEDADATLVDGREYLLLLRPSESSMGNLRRRDGSRAYRDALRAEEVVAIIDPQ